MDESGWQVPVDAPRRYQDVVWRFMVPFAESLVGSTVRPGDAVLDVACGTGFAARRAAGVAGSTGRVVGSDINVSMLAFASAISAETQDGIRWDEASALDLPYGEGEFDSVICQQGVQFFPEPSIGLTEMARVTKPGGRIGATVWTYLSDTPYFEAMFNMLRDFCGADEKDLIWWSDAHQIAEWFTSAGVGGVSVERVEHLVSLPPLDEFIPAHMAATPWAHDFAALPGDQTVNAIRYMRDHLGDRIDGQPITTPFVSHLATGTV
jgi:SAM-dependent methyltransferase